MLTNVLIRKGTLFFARVAKITFRDEKIQKWKNACHFGFIQSRKLKFSWCMQNEAQNWKNMFYKTELEKLPCKVQKQNLKKINIFKIKPVVLIFANTGWIQPKNHIDAIFQLQQWFFQLWQDLDFSRQNSHLWSDRLNKQPQIFRIHAEQGADLEISFFLQSSENYSQSLKKPENTKKHAIVKPFNQDGWQFYGHCGLILRSSLCSKLKLMKIVFAVHLPRALCCFAASMLGNQAIPIALLHSSCPLLAVTWFRLKPFESVWICYRQEMRTQRESSLRHICRVNARQPNQT